MIFSRELKSNLSKLFAWLLVIAILTGLLMAIYPLMLDGNMKSIFDSFLSSLSDNVKNILGFKDELDYTDISEYLGFIFQYVAVFIAMFAMQLGANSLAKEQSQGSIGYIYSNPISRSEIVTQKLLANILTYFIMLVLLALVTFGIVYVIQTEVELSMQIVIFAIAKIFGGMFIGGLVFMSIGLFFSSMSKSTNFTEGTSILFVLLAVLVTVFGKIYGSTFKMIVEKFTLEVFNPVFFVKEQFDFTGMGINLVILIIFILLSYVIYSSKELDY
ncbi:ABC transporter permease subunit [Peptoniphilus asaccharolyticus]